MLLPVSDATVPSAGNKSVLCLRLHKGKSLINDKNMIRPNTEPRGTPDFTWFKSDKVFEIETTWWLQLLWYNNK